MNNLSCPVFKKIKDYDNYSGKIYHKDEVKSDLIEAIDEKHYPFFVKSYLLIIGLIMIILPFPIAYIILHDYILKIPNDDGCVMSFNDMFLGVGVSLIFLLLGIFLFMQEFMKFISTLKIRAGKYNVMLMEISDKDMAEESRTEVNDRTTSIHYKYYLIFDDMRVVCNADMYAKSNLGDICALLISGKYIIGVTDVNEVYRVRLKKKSLFDGIKLNDQFDGSGVVSNKTIGLGDYTKYDKAVNIMNSLEDVNKNNDKLLREGTELRDDEISNILKGYKLMSTPLAKATLIISIVFIIVLFLTMFNILLLLFVLPVIVLLCYVPLGVTILSYTKFKSNVLNKNFKYIIGEVKEVERFKKQTEGDSTTVFVCNEAHIILSSGEIIDSYWTLPKFGDKCIFIKTSDNDNSNIINYYTCIILNHI